MVMNSLLLLNFPLGKIMEGLTKKVNRISRSVKLAVCQAVVFV